MSFSCVPSKEWRHTKSDISIVIADEAHRLKEPRAAITLAMKKIQCSSCFALTGTLVQNRMDEMWSVLDYVRTPTG